MVSPHSEALGQRWAGTRSLSELAHGTSGTATFQQKPPEVFGDGVAVELRPGRGTELPRGGCGCSPSVPADPRPAPEKPP